MRNASRGEARSITMVFRLLTIAILCAGLGVGPAFADKTSRLMRKAQRYFEPLSEKMPGSEKDTAERVALNLSGRAHAGNKTNSLGPCGVLCIARRLPASRHPGAA